MKMNEKDKLRLNLEILNLLTDCDYTFDELAESDKLSKILGYNCNLMNGDSSEEDMTDGISRLLLVLSQLIGYDWIILERGSNIDGHLVFRARTSEEVVDRAEMKLTKMISGKKIS